MLRAAALGFFGRALQQRDGNFRGPRALRGTLHVRVSKPSCGSHNGDPTKVSTVTNVTIRRLSFAISFLFQAAPLKPRAPTESSDLSEITMSNEYALFCFFLCRRALHSARYEERMY